MTAFVPSVPLQLSKKNATGRVEFPRDFLWGAATAAFQIEGAAHEDGRQDSIWDAFCRVPGAVSNADNGDVACDHYHRYAEDVALMKSLNLGAYRFSTSWARVHPGGGAVNPQGVDFYSRLVDQLLEADIQPWLTLYHWDLPQALEEAGGWTNRDTAYRFAEYAVTMHEALGDRVRVWTTLNEPWCASFLSYTAGIHAPGRQSKPDGVAAAHHLLLGHGLAVRELRARDAAATLGITLNCTVADPLDPDDPVDADAARRIDGQYNRVFADPLFHGEYPPDVMADLAPYGLADVICDGDLEIISTPIDTLGVNYYNGSAVTGHPAGTGRPVVTATESDAAAATGADDVAGAALATQAGPGGHGDARTTSSPFPAAEDTSSPLRGLPLTDMGWEVQPEGLTRLLMRLQQDYTGPAGVALYVTENGAAYPDAPPVDGVVDDADRLAYIDMHLRAAKDAMDAGVDLRGYFAWSLLDNFEWAFGYTKRFGIVYVDYATQERTIKSSGHWYSQVARDSAVPQRP